MDKGRNYGLTGLLDLDPPGSAPPIQCKIDGFGVALTAGLVDVFGVGDGHVPAFYASRVDGQFTAHGTVQAKQAPFPPTMRNLSGTLTAQLAPGCTIAVPVMVETLSCTMEDRQADHWLIEVGCRKNGQESVTWQGQAVTFNQPVFGTKELFDSTAKTTDPALIAGTATVKVFVWIGAAGDAAANAVVDAYIAAATPPRAGLKIVNAALFRLDDDAGILLVAWAANDSRDEAELPTPYHRPRSYTLTDVQSMNDEAIVAQVYTGGSPPSVPAAPISGLKLIRYRDDQIARGTDQWSRAFVFGRNDAVDLIERQGTWLRLDPRTIDSEGSITQVAPTTAPPAAPAPPDATLKVVYSTSRAHTGDFSIFTWLYGELDSKDKLESSEITTDPEGLDHRARIALVDATPSAPTVGGTTLVQTGMTREDNLPNGHYRMVGEFGLRTSRTGAQWDETEVSIGTFVTDNTERVVTIEPCLATDTLSALANARLAIVRTTTSPTQGLPFRRLRVRRYHATAVRYTAEYAMYPIYMAAAPDDKIKISGNFRSLRAKSWLGGTNTAPTLSVVSCLSRGTGLWLVQLGKYDALGVGGSMAISQRVSGAAPPLGATSVGKTNSTALFNYPAGSVRYLGANYDIVVSDTISTWDMEYLFELVLTGNWVGFPTLRGIPPGGLIRTTSSVAVGDLAPTSGSGTGPYNWSALNVQANFPAQDAMSFTTWNQT